jgi:hypothetical protein
MVRPDQLMPFTNSRITCFEEGSATYEVTGPSEKRPVDHPLIAVFTQYQRSDIGECFKFTGWYKISRLELFAPHSEGLAQMLTIKWAFGDKYRRVQTRHRDAKAWSASLSHEWAMIKMGKDEKAMEEREEPDIEHFEIDDADGGVSLLGDTDTPKPKTDMNELLAKMGLEDKGAVAQRLWDMDQMFD